MNSCSLKLKEFDNCCFQIGEEGAEEFVNEVRPALTAAATDKSASLDTRAEVIIVPSKIIRGRVI